MKVNWNSLCKTPKLIRRGLAICNRKSKIGTSLIHKDSFPYIKDIRIKNSLITILDKLPEYFYEIPTSSTGKYHPSFSNGEKGLVRHTKAAVRIAKELMDNEALTNFNQNEKDLIIFSLTVHDGLKSGKIKSQYTAFDHPLLISNFLKENENTISWPMKMRWNSNSRVHK